MSIASLHAASASWRCGAETAITTLRSPIDDAPDAVVDRDVAQLVARLQLVGDLGHDLFGHALVGLVLEVRDRAAARMDARRADERRDRAGLVRCDLVDDGFEPRGTVAEEERASGDRRDQRDLVPVGSSWLRSTYALFTA